MPSAKQTGISIMKKILFIAVATSFLFISCSKDELAPQQSQQETVTSDVKHSSKPGPTQLLIVKNLESNSGVVEYVVTYLDRNNVFQTVPLEMGQTISLCVLNGYIECNFANAIKQTGQSC